jgi:cell division protease FtsH
MFLGDESETINYSEATAIKIDEEVNRIINKARKEAEEILTKNRKVLDKIAKTLIKKETIEREEFERLVK